MNADPTAAEGAIHTLSLSRDILPWSALGLLYAALVFVAVISFLLPFFVWGCYRELKKVRRLLEMGRR